MVVPRAIAERVSRETAERLDVFAVELVRWQRALNLVAPSTLPDLWLRHIDDSLQVAELESDARLWIDLGSGGGLPGLIVAAANPDRTTILVESDTRKAAFLRSTARRMDVVVDVRQGRIEAVTPDLIEELSNEVADYQDVSALPGGQTEAQSRIVVSARALAPLDRLLAYAQPLLSAGAIGVFPKGRNAEAELTEAAKSWIFSAQAVPSRTDPEGRIIRIRDFAGPRT